MSQQNKLILTFDFTEDEERDPTQVNIYHPMVDDKIPECKIPEDEDSQNSQEDEQRSFAWRSPSSSQQSMTIDMNFSEAPVILVPNSSSSPITSSASPITSLSSTPVTIPVKESDLLSTSSGDLLQELYLTKKRKYSVLKTFGDITSSSIQSSSVSSTPSSSPPSSVPSTPSSLSAPSSPTRETSSDSDSRRRVLPGWMISRNGPKNTITRATDNINTSKVSEKPKKKSKSISFEDLIGKKSVFPIRVVITDLESIKTALYIISFDKGAKYATCCPPLPEGESDWSCGGVKRSVTFHPNVYSAITEIIESLDSLKKKSWSNKHAALGIFEDVGTLIRGYSRNESTLKQILTTLSSKN